jgi:hypothetical protein
LTRQKTQLTIKADFSTLLRARYPYAFLLRCADNIESREQTGLDSGAVACNVIAARLALLWLKPRVARLVREETEES